MIQVHTTTNQIPKKAYLGNRELIEIMVPYGTTELSDWAFAGCKNLELVLLPDTIQRLGKDVFLNCNHLKRILLFDKAQESVFKEGLLPLWNTKESIQGELFMQAVCRLMMPDAVTLFLKDRKQFFVDIGEQIASYLARPDEEGFAPFLAGERRIMTIRKVIFFIIAREDVLIKYSCLDGSFCSPIYAHRNIRWKGRVKNSGLLI